MTIAEDANKDRVAKFRGLLTVMTAITLILLAGMFAVSAAVFWMFLHDPRGWSFVNASILVGYLVFPLLGLVVGWRGIEIGSSRLAIAGLTMIGLWYGVILSPVAAVVLHGILHPAVR